MSGRRKTTPEVMDRIIQIIWHYQALHRGLTPNYGVIANELGDGWAANRLAPYISNLEKDGRLEKHHVRPFRATILSHIKNTAAVRRYERFLRKQDDHPEDEIRQTITAERPKVEKVIDSKPEVVDAEPASPDKLSPETVAEIPATEPRTLHEAQQRWQPQHPPQNWAEAERIIANLGGNLQLIASTFIIKTARDGELLEELADRGYVIKKARPSRH